MEVRIRDGQTVTELTPSNIQLLKQSQEMEGLPELVFRRFNFPDGVPDEYDWTGPDENVRQYGGGGVQRMTFRTWSTLQQAEEQRRDGVVGTTGRGNLPRPKEHGGCECDVCRSNADLLEE